MEQEVKLAQCTELRANKAFSFKVDGKGRSINAAEGELFMVTTSKTSAHTRIDKVKRAHIGSGYVFTDEQLTELFTVV